jgi:hypothetical protein
LKTTYKTLTLSLIAAAALAACGGGGSGDAAGTATAPVVAAPKSTIVTSVPVATYAAGSDERAAYDLLNTERQKCGFGLLAQNAKLDAAAAAHSNYQLVNNVASHFETQGYSGFTGVSTIERAAAQVYPSAGLGEDIAFEASGIQSMRALLVAPYHLAGLVTGYADVGMSFKSTQLAQQVRAVLTVDLGVQLTRTLQVGEVGSVATYPCAGVDGLRPNFTEQENWAAVSGTGAGGTPIYIVAPNKELLIVSSASITPVGGGVVPVQVLTAANDPQKKLSANQVFVIPPSSLVANTNYRVQISGTVGGAAFTKDFNFKTGV